MSLILRTTDKDCVLRPLREKDAKELFRLTDGNRARLRPWLPWVDGTRTWKDTRAFIRKTLQDRAERKALHFGIWKGKKIAGVVGYFNVDWVNKKAELGYWLGGCYSGQGLMTQACRSLVENAFKKWKLNRVVIRCGVTNKKSQAIPKRLGFKKEGLLRQEEWLYDHYADHVVYGMLSRDWKRKRGK